MNHDPHLVRYTVGIGFETQRFVESALSRRQIDGATIIDAWGYWRNPETGQVETEPSQVLVLTHTSPEDFGFQFATVMAWAQDHGEHTVMVEHHNLVQFVPTDGDWMEAAALLDGIHEDLP